MTDTPDDTEAPASDAGQPEASTAGEGAQAQDGQGPDKSDGKGKRGKFYRELAIILAAAIILTLLVKAFVVQVYSIPSASMDNTLVPGDRVLVNKLVYHFRSIARGDIIVFSGAGSWGDLEGNPIPPPPSNPVERFFDAALANIGIHGNNTFYIKRVIGLPGDHVACCNTAGLLTVNGVALHETGYLYPGAAPSTATFSITVPAGRLWVMGDNRDFSDDSRGHMTSSPDQGTIPESEVAGRAFLIIWPLSRFGDLPIPDTFKQPALNAAPAAAIATALGVPFMIRRRRRRN